MIEYFIYKDAVYDVLRSGRNPLIYENQITEWPSEEGLINIGSTTIYPGEVGGEFYHNRGHYHEKDNTCEIYTGVKGEGRVIMQKKDGETRILPFEPHDVVYIPFGWAHRVANIGKRKMSFMYASPANAGHNYGPIKEKGFKKILVKKEREVEAIENPFF